MGAGNESAVSESVGSILLIAIVALAISIIAVFVLSGNTTTEIPYVDAVITINTTDSNIYYVDFLNNGGDELTYNEVKLEVKEVAGTDIIDDFPVKIKDNSGLWVDWSSTSSKYWNIGVTLRQQVSSAPAQARVIYLGSSTSIIALALFTDQSIGSGIGNPPGSLSVTSSAPTGAYDVIVTNPGGQTASLQNGFTVTSPAPLTVTSITPDTGVQGSTVAITDIAGTGFQTGASVKLTRDGESDIVMTGVTVDSTTKITGTFSIPTNALIGNWNVVVTNPDGQSSMLQNGFTVTASSAPPPTVTSITPGTGTPGSTIPVTSITGSNFQSGATVTLRRVGYPDIQVTYVDVPSSSQIAGTLTIPPGTMPGAYDVIVTNPDGQSGVLPGGFVVTSPSPPTVTSITPDQGTQGSTVQVTNLAGTNFDSGATVIIRQGSTTILMTGLTVASPNQITGTLELPSDAPLGAYDVIVTNLDGQSGTLTGGFTINPPTVPAPTISGITPNTGVQGTTVQVTNLAGTNFQTGATVTLTKPGSTDIVMTGLTVVSSTKITGSLIIPPGAATGGWTVVVKNPDGQTASLPNGFTVTPACPTVKADFIATPSSGPTPLNVAFSDRSTGTPTRWLWDFGDGGTSTLQHPTHVYSNIGRYTVTLTASNDCSTDTVIKSDAVVTTASFTGSVINLTKRCGGMGRMIDGTYIQFESGSGTIAIDGTSYTVVNNDKVKLVINGDQTTGSMYIDHPNFQSCSFNVKLYIQDVLVATGYVTAMDNININKNSNTISTLSYTLDRCTSYTKLIIDGVTILDSQQDSSLMKITNMNIIHDNKDPYVNKLIIDLNSANNNQINCQGDIQVN